MDYITRTELQRMVDACDPTTLAGKRDRLLLVVLRALNGRAGEVADLSVVHCEPPLLVLFVRGEIVEIPCGEFTNHDPSQLWDSWMYEVDGLFGQGEGPVFRRITKDDRLSTRGHPCDQGKLTAGAINHIVKRAAARAGLDRLGRTGELEDYPTARLCRDIVLEDYVVLRMEGYGLRDCARRIGMKQDALEQALRRARKAGDPRVKLPLAS